MPGDDLLLEMFSSFIFNVIIHTAGVKSRHSNCFLTLILEKGSITKPICLHEYLNAFSRSWKIHRRPYCSNIGSLILLQHYQGGESESNLLCSTIFVPQFVLVFYFSIGILKSVTKAIDLFMQL